MYSSTSIFCVFCVAFVLSVGQRPPLARKSFVLLGQLVVAVRWKGKKRRSKDEEQEEEREEEERGKRNLERGVGKESGWKSKVKAADRAEEGQT